jgi:hypothetical protein
MPQCSLLAAASNKTQSQRCKVSHLHEQPEETFYKVRANWPALVMLLTARCVSPFVVLLLGHKA